MHVNIASVAIKYARTAYLTVHWVFLGNAIALIVVELLLRKAITLLTWSYLNRLKVVACGNIKYLYGK